MTPIRHRDVTAIPPLAGRTTTKIDRSAHPEPHNDTSDGPMRRPPAPSTLSRLRARRSRRLAHGHGDYRRHHDSLSVAPGNW
jgi:hypothetical protein